MHRLLSFLRRMLCWDRPFLRSVLMVALPMVAQQLVAASLHIVDGLMVSAMGDAAYSAVTQANRITFVFNLFSFGTSTGGAIFLSQFWGARDVRRMRHAMGLTLCIVAFTALLFATLAQVMPRGLISLFLQPGESFELAVKYLRIVSIGYLFTAVDQAYSSCIKAAEKTWIPMLSSIVSIAVNTLLNYMLIFGRFGAPALGVEGAAIATVVSAFVAMAMDMTFAYAQKLPAGASLRQLLGFDRLFAGKYIKTVLPVIFNEGMWGMGTTMYSVYYGRMGDAAVATMGVCSTINDLIWVAIFALASATSILIGKKLGAGDRDGAYRDSSRLLAGTIVLSIVLGALIIAVRGPMVSIFGGLSEEVRQKAELILMIGGLCMWFRAYNTVNIVGVLRSGGDTIFSLIFDTGVLWVVGVPLTGIAALVLKWPLEGVFICSLVEEIIKMAVCVPRFASRKWIHVLTDNA